MNARALTTKNIPVTSCITAHVAVMTETMGSPPVMLANCTRQSAGGRGVRSAVLEWDELASHRQWWRAPLELQRTYPQCERHHDRFEARQEEQHAEEVLVLRPEQRRRTVVACRGSPPF